MNVLFITVYAYLKFEVEAFLKFINYKLSLLTHDYDLLRSFDF